MLTLLIALYAIKIDMIEKTKVFFTRLHPGRILKMLARLIFSLGLIANISLAQTSIKEFSFTVKKGNDTIGKMKTLQVIKGDKIIRTLSAAYNISFLFDFKVTEYTSDVFENNKLVASEMRRTINGKEKIYNLMKWTGTGYEIKKKDNESSTMNDIIFHAVSCLYFDEPHKYVTAFSPCYQNYAIVKMIEPHKYLFELPNGTKAYYTYNNGILVIIEGHPGWATITYTLDNPLASK